MDILIGQLATIQNRPNSKYHRTTLPRKRLLKQKIPTCYHTNFSSCLSVAERQLSSILNTCNKHSSLVLVIVIVSPSRYLSSKFNLTDRQRPSLARVVQEVHHSHSFLCIPWGIKVANSFQFSTNST